MNNKIKRIAIPTIALSFMLMLPARAVEPTVATGELRALPESMAFQLPVNNYCSPEDSLDFSFQLSNTSANPADITLFFYKLDGSKFNVEGSSYREINSTIVPGKPFSLAGYATGLYHINFGNHIKCSDRAYLGRIIVNSGKASLIARGWVTKSEQIEPVDVNNNHTFELMSPPLTSETIRSEP
ncbi:hypothetical protein ACFQI7_26005 [Paenibacillus allorhizosphaerae]|uniref:Intracellular proteinase inhibitor BsuPI domain-containing protein n=1 Tax=Paenibacillus allorhizosphaerae TaxID=2849866 RepID=A0ABM8VJL2_9BACL|nr:hypothetical protein [Paenibacillus allorhizosphaerae]CAG7645676.1 hypothetical protein PAECIP111802_03577 [Paenibacillus allorhizosphaerae]